MSSISVEDIIIEPIFQDSEFDILDDKDENVKKETNKEKEDKIIREKMGFISNPKIQQLSLSY